MLYEGHADGFKLITDVPEKYIEYSENMGKHHEEETFDNFQEAKNFILNLEKVPFKKGEFWDEEEDDEDFDL